MALLLVRRASEAGLSSGVNFVHDYEVCAICQELKPATVALGKINRDDGVRIVAIEAGGTDGDASLQLCNGRSADHLSMDVEFFGKLVLPLFTQVGRAQDA